MASRKKALWPNPPTRITALTCLFAALIWSVTNLSTAFTTGSKMALTASPGTVILFLRIRKSLLSCRPGTERHWWSASDKNCGTRRLRTWNVEVLAKCSLKLSLHLSRTPKSASSHDRYSLSIVHARQARISSLPFKRLVTCLDLRRCRILPPPLLPRPIQAHFQVSPQEILETRD